MENIQLNQSTQNNQNDPSIEIWEPLNVKHFGQLFKDGALRFYCSIGPFGRIELMQELESSRPVGAKGLEGPPP